MILVSDNPICRLTLAATRELSPVMTFSETPRFFNWPMVSAILTFGGDHTAEGRANSPYRRGLHVSKEDLVVCAQGRLCNCAQRPSVFQVILESESQTIGVSRYAGNKKDSGAA